MKDLEEAKGMPVITYEYKLIDRNNDGKYDLIESIVKVPEMEYRDPATDKNKKQEGFSVKQLYIDDDFDDYIERVLTDSENASGKQGMDGIYDAEQHSTRISDFAKSLEGAAR